MAGLRYAVWMTPAAPLTVVTRDGVVVAAGFTDRLERLSHLAGTAGLTADGEVAAALPADDLGPVGEAVDAYLAGDLRAVEDVPVAGLDGEGFMARAWRAMRTIPAGRPASYGWLAEAAGGDGWEAARAAGQACARNPSSLFVP